MTNASRFTIEEIKFAILGCFASIGSQEKYNLLGRGGMTGDIDSQLKAELTPDERSLAVRAFDELYQKEFFQHNTTNIVGTDNWYEITEKGKRALSSRVLDDLDKALNEIDPRLKTLRYGAREAARNYTFDGIRQGAHSARELARQLLAKMAPNEEVMKQSWYKVPTNSETPVTRAMRIKLILSKRNLSSKLEANMIENCCKLIDNLYEKLSGEAHLDVSKKHDDFDELIRLTESGLKKLLIG